MRVLRPTAVVVWIATVALVAAAVLQVLGLLATTRLAWIPAWNAPFFMLAVLTPASVGLLIALRLPRNVIAWILLLGALVIAAPVDLLLSEGWGLQTDRAS